MSQTLCVVVSTCFVIDDNGVHIDFGSGRFIKENGSRWNKRAAFWKIVVQGIMRATNSHADMGCSQWMMGNSVSGTKDKWLIIDSLCKEFWSVLQRSLLKQLGNSKEGSKNDSIQKTDDTMLHLVLAKLSRIINTVGNVRIPLQTLSKPIPGNFTESSLVSDCEFMNDGSFGSADREREWELKREQRVETLSWVKV